MTNDTKASAGPKSDLLDAVVAAPRKFDESAAEAQLRAQPDYDEAMTFRRERDAALAALASARAELERYKGLYEQAVIGRQQFRASFHAARTFSERYRVLRDCEDGTFAVFMPRVHGHIAFSGEALDQKIDAHLAGSDAALSVKPRCERCGGDREISNVPADNPEFGMSEHREPCPDCTKVKPEPVPKCAHCAGCEMPAAPGDIYCAPCRSGINDPW